ncbi:hypothetical protein FQR65_LT19501 [Abscondita terminalis]|nr:hypothetical protein FQR65_LT19501 [Abscondita terminalis]
MRWAAAVLRAGVASASARGWLARLDRRKTSVFALTAGALVAVSLVATLSQSGTLSKVKGRISDIFAPVNKGQLLTLDEGDVLERLPDLVPKDGVIVGNPFTGAALAYAFSDRNVVAPHMFGTRTEDEQFLLDHWSEAAYNPRVCEIVKKKNAYWALDFGKDTVIETNDRYLGVDRLPDDLAPGIDVVYQKGEARLVKATYTGIPPINAKHVLSSQKELLKSSTLTPYALRAAAAASGSVGSASTRGFAQAKGSRIFCARHSGVDLPSVKGTSLITAICDPLLLQLWQIDRSSQIVSLLLGTSGGIIDPLSPGECRRDDQPRPSANHRSNDGGTPMASTATDPASALKNFGSETFASSRCLVGVLNDVTLDPAASAEPESAASANNDRRSEDRGRAQTGRG